MDLLVAHDLGTGGDAALLAALRMAAAEPDLSIGVVHVLSQIDLDRTGELDAEAKQRVAVERTFPTLWRRIEDTCNAERVESDDLDLDVLVRVAAVHLVRSQETIAARLLAVAREHGATRIVLGAQGRTGSVAEHLLAHARRVEAPGDAAPAVILVEVTPAA